MTTIFGGKAPEALHWDPLPYMEDYLENLEADGRSPTYLRTVKLGLTRFALFLRSEEGIKHPDEITRAHIVRYQAHLATLVHAGQPLATSYRQQQMKYARGWINWLEQVEHIERNPWVRIRIGRVNKKPKPLEEDELAALFAAHKQQAFTLPPFFFHRRESLLVLLFGWGLRIHEAQALTVTALDMRLEWVTSRNKGGGEKVLPYGTEMKQILARYLTHRSKYAKPGDDSFLIDQTGKQLSYSSAYKVIIDLGQRAGVTINPHRLRDTFGTTMLNSDVPVERIMKIMGHTKREQTLAYSRVNEPKVKQSHDEVMNPLLQKLLGGAPPVSPEGPS